MMPLATAMGAGIAPAQVNYGDAHMITSRFIREMGAAVRTGLRLSADHLPRAQEVASRAAESVVRG